MPINISISRKKIGVDAVKFQIFKTENYVCLRIAYGKLSKKNSLKSTDQFNNKKLELNTK